ncbi:hypothetical protein MKX01_026400, partial [Papaver californicum]
DPVTVSAGWRRYQTKPIYAREIDNPCVVMFWGPLAPPHTRITVVHRTKEVFRVAAKAVVVDPNHHFKIMKRSKRKGKPHKILNERTALIKFEAEDVDVAEFKGASIRTEDGIWGEVIKVCAKLLNHWLPSICFYDTTIHKRTVQASGMFQLLSLIVCPNSQCLLKYEENILTRKYRASMIFIYPFNTYFVVVFILQCNKGKETVVVMPEEKRAELVKRQQQIEESKKRSWIGVDDDIWFRVKLFNGLKFKKNDSDAVSSEE